MKPGPHLQRVLAACFLIVAFAVSTLTLYAFMMTAEARRILQGLSTLHVPTPIGKPYLLVAIDAKSTPEQRRRACAFSLICLVKPGGGCDLPCDYLPLAWKDWESELASAGDFGEHYPNRSRCK
jgi:hypothetical protein